MVTATAKSNQSKAFDIKGGLFTLTSLQINDPNLKAIDQQLQSALSQMPKFFHNAPIVVDLTQIQALDIVVDFAAMQKLLRQHGLFPVGIKTSSEHLQNQAIDAGIPCLTHSTSETSAKKEKQETVETVETVRAASKMITQPVRSGQQIYAKNGDLVIVSSVSVGAEVLADGHIHVYGPLRGRAIAGINGDTNARIFCTTLEAELVSIAGRYLLREQFTPPENHTVTQIYLDGEELKIECL